MRMVVTSDTHFIFSPDKIPDGDVFVHCGDLMYTGYPSEWNGVVASLAALPHKIKLLVPGNHDFHIQNYNGIARAELRRRANVMLLDEHRPEIEIDGIRFLACPFMEGLPGWAYNRSQEEIEEWLNKRVAPDIMLTHSPIYNVLDACNPEHAVHYKQEHVGSIGMHRWYQQQHRPPKHWFHGHIHESYGSIQEGECWFHNVAMCDRQYKQVNKPYVLEI